ATQLQHYGADEHEIRKLIQGDPSLGASLNDEVPILAAQVVWAARMEMARTVDDVLSRRTRALFLHARAAIEMAPAVAKLLAAELGRDERWEADQVRQFTSIAQGYLVTGITSA